MQIGQFPLLAICVESTFMNVPISKDAFRPATLIVWCFKNIEHTFLFFHFLACHLLNVCTTTNNTRLDEYRKFVQGATASFFITELQGRPDAINYIADQSKSPLKLLLDKSDLKC